MKNQLGKFEKDQLLEVVTVGAGNASSALSQMMEKRVNIEVPDAIVDDLENISSYIGDPDELITTILLKMSGEAPGFMLLMLPPQSALKLAGYLTKNYKKDVKILDEMDRSALREIGNIVTGNSITALSKFLNISIVQSIPEVVTDMMGSIVDSIVSEVGEETESVLVFRVNFSVEDHEIDGKLFFIFDPTSTEKILEITDDKLNK
jgi:chemotaxis protein CheC